MFMFFSNWVHAGQLINILVISLKRYFIIYPCAIIKKIILW